jgi:hypothetical protein
MLDGRAHGPWASCDECVKTSRVPQASPRSWRIGVRCRPICRSRTFSACVKGVMMLFNLAVRPQLSRRVAPQ